MHWDVVELKVQENLKIFVRFADGTSGSVKFTPQHLTGVFKPLNDPIFFSKAYINDGVVTWPNEIDLAPDAMYQAIKKNGEWILK